MSSHYLCVCVCVYRLCVSWWMVVWFRGNCWWAIEQTLDNELLVDSLLLLLFSSSLLVQFNSLLYSWWCWSTISFYVCILMCILSLQLELFGLLLQLQLLLVLLLVLMVVVLLLLLLLVVLLVGVVVLLLQCAGCYLYHLSFFYAQLQHQLITCETVKTIYNCVLGTCYQHLFFLCLKIIFAFLCSTILSSSLSECVF